MESTLIPAPRIFVDSSVLMAAALSRTGSAHDLVQLGVERQVTLLISSLVVSEVERNLGRKAQAKLPNLQRILEICSFDVVDPPAELVSAEKMKIEPKDAAIVAAAVAGSARFLVTYDEKHLLAQAAQIEGRHGIVVCSPAMAISFLIDRA